MCMCARVCAYVCACMIEKNKTHDHDRHTTRTHDHRRKREEHGKPAYIGKIADNEKSIKKVKKNLELRKKVVSLHHNNKTKQYGKVITKVL